MQNININDIYSDRISTNSSELKTSLVNEAKEKSQTKVSENFTLRNIDIAQPFYNQKDVRTNAEELEAKLSSGQSELQRKNNLTLAMAGMTKQDFSKMKEDGFSPEETDDEAYVTIADKIRIQLAKGGADISMMGGVSDEAMEAIGGGAEGKLAIENALAKASEVSEITDDTKRYLIKNEALPTIENVHKAAFSISEKYEYKASDSGVTSISDGDFEALKPQLEDVIKRAGLAVNDESLYGAKWLLNQKLPLTEDSIAEYITLSKSELKTDRNSVLEAIYESVAEGKSPEQGFIVSGYSPKEIAKSATYAIKNISDIKIENAVKNNDPITISSIMSQSDTPVGGEIEQDSKQEYEFISSKRAMEELRLSMTLEASFSMSMRGIKIDTTPLVQLVDELKAEETRLYNALFGDDKVNSSNGLSFENRISIYEETNVSIENLKSEPAAILGAFSSVSSISISSLNSVVSSQTAKYKAAGDTYEALMTAPRKDMGDSIKKAFRNVDDILKDLGFEATESNERAVRILGYNSLDINKENVLRMREADSTLQYTFKELRPGVVANMVKNGINPLDMSLDELNKKIREIKQELGDFSEEEKYAEFLYKMDRQEGLSAEERDSFVGIYRLMHQVTESDGAVIGALLNQGADITMRNMMMAIRSDKHKNRESVIDDNFGVIKSFNKNVLSITDQIEMAFQTERIRDAKDSVSPSKLSMFESEDTYMNMNPDQLASALENMEENEEDNQACLNELKENVDRAVQSETKVYEALRRFDIPTSPANLRAMESFLSDRNGIYRKVFSNTVTDEDLKKTPKELMADIIRRFGEAVKTPEDMAKAQEKLAETAENVMKEMLVEAEVSHIDIRGMRVSLKQVQMLGEIAEKRENYTIPITVADENGTLNLKIVRGSNDENGLVDIAFDMEKTGPVSAVFKASADGVTGSISAVEKTILDRIADMEERLVDSLSKATGTNVSIGFVNNTKLTTEEAYSDKEPGFETTTSRSEIATAKLYAMAKSFIDILGDI